MTRGLTVWPAALNLAQAAEYCDMPVEAFLRACPLQPIPLADGRYLTIRLEEWLNSLPGDWKPVDDATILGIAGKQPGWIYVAGFSHYVKIGYTTREVEGRIASLQTGCPEIISIYAAFRGSKAIEALLHSRYRELRTQGEWFRREGSLAAWIEGGCK